ncbi:AAA family ATPase, partial [Candidatus Kaiserbacteria bacterium]|nr:AAA family ATPase [Candidatus Kaiserbacteria bacterium]
MKTFIAYPDKEEKVEEKFKFEPITWAELEKKQVRPIEWLVEDVIPEPSLCLIASRGGVGKTLVTLEIVRQIIEGGMFLGKYQCKKTKVLYI